MKDRATKTPGIPDLRDDNVKEVLAAIKSTMEVREARSGDALDAHVTFRNLSALGLGDKDGKTTTADGDLPLGPPGSGGIGDTTGYNPSGDMSTPPAPTGLVVNGGFVAIYLEWNGAPYHNHAYTEVWRAPTDNLGTAIMVGTAIMSGYADPVEPDSEYFYWIRFHSQANVVGPYNSQSGMPGHTALDVGKAIEALSEDLQNSTLWGSLTSRIAKIEADQYIANASQNAQIRELSAKQGGTTGRIIELWDVSEGHALELKVLEARGPGNGSSIFFTPDRPDAGTPGFVDGVPLGAGDIWYDTNDANRSYRWSGTAWVEFVTAGAKVYHQPNPPHTFDGTNWVDATGRLMRDGDLWYDSDSTPANHPYRWTDQTHEWLDIAGADNSAAILTLEQTKIGYATLNVNSPFGAAGSVFDNNGAIWNNVSSAQSNADYPYTASVQNWNATHVDNAGTDSKLTWHIGIPFAQSVKQVGVTTTDAQGNQQNITVQQQFIAMQTTDNKLIAQYTVKIDANGYIAGFGLSVDPPQAGLGPTSAFVVTADKFGIGPAIPADAWASGAPYSKYATVWMQQGGTGPKHVFQARQSQQPGHTPTWGAWKLEQDAWWTDLSVRLPFITTTTNQVIDGKSYPPGVWMNVANIAEAHIVSAQIYNLVADKITAGEIFAAISMSTSGYIYGGVVPSQPMASPTYGKGFFLGVDGSTIKFYVGETDLHYMMWDGTNLTVRGTIIGLAGRIGGINLSMQQSGAGSLYSNGVSGFEAGASGFYLDSASQFRIGNPGGSRLTWDGGLLRIYNQSNQVILAGGNIAWGAIPDVPPTVQNSNVGIQFGANGSIVMTGGGPSNVTGVISPAWRITGSNIGAYIESAAISRAYIGFAAIGEAQIENAAITNAKIGNLAVDTINIAGMAVTVPSGASSSFTEQVGYSPVTLFGGSNCAHFTLNSSAPLLIGMFTTELAQGSGNSGSTIELTCYLTWATGESSVTFKVGIINNQPDFSQTAAFAFSNVPADEYWMRIVARQISGSAAANNFGKKVFVSTVYKK